MSPLAELRAMRQQHRAVEEILHLAQKYGRPSRELRYWETQLRGAQAFLAQAERAAAAAKKRAPAGTTAEANGSKALGSGALR